MTTRQRIKSKMVSCALRAVEDFSQNRQGFNLRMAELWDSFTDTNLTAELDRMEALPSGLSRLLTEAWNEYQTELLQITSLEAYNKMVVKNV